MKIENKLPADSLIFDITIISSIISGISIVIVIVSVSVVAVVVGVVVLLLILAFPFLHRKPWIRRLTKGTVWPRCSFT